MKRLFYVFFVLLAVYLVSNSPTAHCQQHPIPSLDNVEVAYLIDLSKKDRGVCYAGKFTWDGQIWRRQVVVYNNSPKPPMGHPVYEYTENLTPPTYRGRQKWETPSGTYREFACE